MEHRFRNNALNNAEAPNNRQSASTEMPSNQAKALSGSRCSRALSGPTSTSTFPTALVPHIPANAITGDSSTSESSKKTYAVHTPERSVSQESQVNYSVNRQLAMSSIKGNIRAIKFDGKDKASYSPWKTALELEIEELVLSAAEWLEILQLRTSEVALRIF